jgi:hypothetical protein
MDKINKVDLENFNNIKSNIYDLIYMAADFYNRLLIINNISFLRGYNKLNKILDIEKYDFLGSAVIDYFNDYLKVSIKERDLYLYINSKFFNCSTTEEVKTFVYERLKNDINIEKSLLELKIATSNEELKQLNKEDIKTIE